MRLNSMGRGRPHRSGCRRRWPGRLAALLVALALAISSCAGTGWSANADVTTDVVLVDLDDPSQVAAWTTLNDPVMGGLSTSAIKFGDGGLVFSGSISLENNGGFASARGPLDPDIGRKAGGAKSLRIRAMGDGRTYLLKVGTAGQPWSYIQRFRTDAGAARAYELPVEGFRAVGMRLDPAPEAPQALDPSMINQVSVYILDKQQGPFELTISAIEAAIP
jgi:hypothetical protein